LMTSASVAFPDSFLVFLSRIQPVLAIIRSSSVRMTRTVTLFADAEITPSFNAFRFSSSS
jgi:hypothetical protein